MVDKCKAWERLCRCDAWPGYTPGPPRTTDLPSTGSLLGMYMCPVESIPLRQRAHRWWPLPPGRAHRNSPQHHRQPSELQGPCNMRGPEALTASLLRTREGMAPNTLVRGPPPSRPACGEGGYNLPDGLHVASPFLKWMAGVRQALPLFGCPSQIIHPATQAGTPLFLLRWHWRGPSGFLPPPLSLGFDGSVSLDVVIHPN